jgi:excinuclease ABC subunit A
VLEPERVVPDGSLSLADGAIEPWRGRRHADYYAAVLGGLAEALSIDLGAPWSSLSEAARRAILFGEGLSHVQLSLSRGRRRKRISKVKRAWTGVAGELARMAESEESAEKLARYVRPDSCAECGGARLRSEARSVLLGGRSLPELVKLPILELESFLDRLVLEARAKAVAERVLGEIRERLRFLADVGLDYLTLDRPSATLSGGEGQRIRLATQIGSKLTGVLFVLDEPSIGLHPRDHRRLLTSLEKLRDQGNSVVVVEHDRDTIERAQHVIDMGPGAGTHGGMIVAQGTPDEIARDPSSPTGAFLSGRRSIPVPARRSTALSPHLELRGCREHNLKNVTLRLPLGCFVVVTGVSGSGKSTLVGDTLHRALASRFFGALERPGAFDEIRGLEQLDKVIDVSQAPIGRTPRSNPATFCGAFDGIRNLLAQVPEARMRGYEPGRFSFNVAGGRCETCKGDGSLRIEMHFLPDVFVPCDVCGGRRYQDDTLEVRFKGFDIAQILELSVEQALEVFAHNTSVARPLQALHDVGLDYLKLGQPATTLSGGEAQRLKLARELSKRATGRTLYLLDEPTTGLHFSDIDQLLGVLHKLVDQGNSVLVIEHQLDVIKSADFVIDLGPEAGERGGEIVVQGTPEEVAACERSFTGRALGELFASATSA